MRRDYIRRILLYLKNEQNRIMWRRILYGLACVVVFFTVYALILPAITIEQEYYCGIAVHAHDEDCYQDRTVSQIVCPQETSGLHQHTGSCYHPDGGIVCGYSDTPVHHHDERCYDAAGALVCVLPEISEHTHGDGCFDETGELVCGLAQVQLHTHTDECFNRIGEVVCGMTEVIAHQHTEECVLQDVVYRELICTEVIHVHDENCKPNTEADLETAYDWEQSVSTVSLTDVWNEDIVSIARTQLGYTESQRNYLVENGERLSGYTRYGAWYGTPYVEWDAVFASFCLNYAGIPYEAVSRDSDAVRWAETLQKNELLFSGENYIPAAGDLVFFRNVQGEVERVGIYTSSYSHYNTETNEPPVTYIWAIEGNADNAVAECRTEIAGVAPLYCSLSAARDRYEVLCLGREGEYVPPAEPYKPAPYLITQSAETENYIVSVTYSSELELPENAVLQVSEYARDSEIFRQRCEEAGYELDWLLNIGFFVDGAELELDGDFDVVVTSKTGESLGEDITHFGDSGNERISGTGEQDEEQSSVSFSSGGFSDFGGGSAKAAEDVTNTQNEAAAYAAAAAAETSYSFYEFTTVDSASLAPNTNYVVYTKGSNGEIIFLTASDTTLGSLSGSIVITEDAFPGLTAANSDIIQSANDSDPSTGGGTWYIPTTTMNTEPTLWRYSTYTQSGGNSTTYERLAPSTNTTRYLTLGQNLSLTQNSNTTFTDQSDAGAIIQARSGRTAYYVNYNNGWTASTSTNSRATVYFATYTTISVEIPSEPEEEVTPTGNYYKFTTVNPDELVIGESYVVYCRPANTTSETTDYTFLFSKGNVISGGNYPQSFDISTISDFAASGYATQPVTRGGVWYVAQDQVINSTTGADSLEDILWKYGESTSGDQTYATLAALGYSETEYLRVSSSVRTWNNDSGNGNVVITKNSADTTDAGATIYGVNDKRYLADNTSTDQWSGVTAQSGAYTMYFAKVEEVGEPEEPELTVDNTIYYPQRLCSEDYIFHVMSPDEEFVEGQRYIIYYINEVEGDGTYPGVKLLGGKNSQTASIPVGINKDDPTTNNSIIDAAELDYLRAGGYRWQIDADVLDSQQSSGNYFMWKAVYDGDQVRLQLDTGSHTTGSIPSDYYLSIDSTQGLDPDSHVGNKNSVRTMTLDESSGNFYINAESNPGEDNLTDSWRIISTGSESSYLVNNLNDYKWYATDDYTLVNTDTTLFDTAAYSYKFYIAKAMSYPVAVETSTVDINALRFYNFAEDGFQGDGNTSAAALPGCTFVVTDQSGNIVETIVTESAVDPEIGLTLEKYTTGVTYTITETEVPPGYAKDANPIRTFSIEKDAEGDVYFAIGDDEQYDSIGIFVNHKLSQVESNKNAQYVDYANRIYEVMLSLGSNMREYAIDPIDVLFVVDQSNSMLFPSGLVPLTDSSGAEVTLTLKRGSDKDADGNNLSDEAKAERDAAETAFNVQQLEELFASGKITRDKLYYVVADKDQKSTVYAIWYDGDAWIYQDASFYAKAYYGNGIGYQEDGIMVTFAGDHAPGTVERTLTYTDENGDTVTETTNCKTNGASFNYRLGYDLGDDITNDKDVTYIEDENGNLVATEIPHNGTATYTIYTAYDGYNRLHYLQDSLSNAVYQLSESNTENRVKLITFTRVSDHPQNENLCNKLYELDPDGVEALVDAVGKIYTTGGTRQDIALEHAYNHLMGTYADDETLMDRDPLYTFTVLITDGAPNLSDLVKLGEVTDEPLSADATAEELEAATVFQLVRYWADKVKTRSILMTIGLGMTENTGGDIILEEIATTPSYYMLIENSSQLRDSLKPMLFGAMIPKGKVYAQADVVDVISDSFYPIAWVDNSSGNNYYGNTAGRRVVETDDSSRKWIVLEEGDWITLEGKLTTADAKDKAGLVTVAADGSLCISWSGQVVETAAGSEKVLAWVTSRSAVPSGRTVEYVENGRYYFELNSGEWVTKNSDQTNKFQYYGTSEGSSDSVVYGQLKSDSVGSYIYWNDQVPLNSDRDYISLGWKGVVYLKAKEDFIGGNAIDTNKSASATIRTSADAAIDAGSALTDPFGVPNVNVRLLPMNTLDTEITVFLGDQVNRFDSQNGTVDLSSPSLSLKYFYDNTFIQKIGWDPNYVRNCSFEINNGTSDETNDYNLNVWVWDYSDGDLLIKNSENGDGDDAFTGTCYLNFTDRNGDGIDLDVYQTITGLEPGTYMLSAMVNGGDPVGVENMYIYADNGSLLKDDFELKGWRVWQNPTVEVTVPASGELKVGIRVECDSAWGSIDDIVLMKLPEESNEINNTAMDDSSAFSIADSGIDYNSGLQFTQFDLDHAIGEIDWNTIAQKGTYTVPYTYDNASSNGPVGQFVFTLSKSGIGSSYSQHTAIAAGEAVETYSLTVRYEAYELGTDGRPAANTLNGVNMINSLEGPGTEVGGSSAGSTLETGYGSVTVTDTHIVNVIDGSIGVEKVIDESMVSDKDMTFTFTLHRTEDGAVTDNDRSGSITVRAGETVGSASILWDNLPRGTYTVTEQYNPEYQVGGIEIKDSTNCYTATGEGDVVATFVIGSDPDGNDVISTEGSGNYPYSDYIAGYDTSSENDGVFGAAVFTNTTTEYEGLVTVTKVWSGDGEPDADSLHEDHVVYVVLCRNGVPVETDGRVRMVKLTAENNWTASFTVPLSSSTDKVYDYGYSVAELSSVDTRKSDELWQSAVLENPSDGESTEYYFDKLLEDGERLEFTNPDLSYNVVYQEAVIDTGSERGDVTLTVTNERAYVMPKTGGSGALILMVNGAMYIAFALRYGYNQSKKRKGRA